MSNATVTKTLKVTYRQEGASELERAAKAIARAQQTVAEASAGAFKVIEGGTVRIGGAERSYRALQSRLEGMGRATKQFHADLKALDGAMSAGIIKGAEYSRQLAKIQANLEKAGAPTGADTGRAFDISKRFGIGAEISNPARESASVFEQTERAAERLRSQLYPLSAAQRELNDELASYRTLALGGAISSRELADAEAMVGARMAMIEKTMGATGGAAKLTANQFSNLGYQVNDIGTMLAMGASPFQILASQGGQVVQALGDGPGGVKGSLAAIGTGIAAMVTPATAVAAGFVAAGAAAIYFATRGTGAVKSISEAVEAHKTAIGGITAGYKAAADAVDRYSNASRDVLGLQERRSRNDLELAQRRSVIEGFDAGIASPIFARGGQSEMRVASEFSAFEPELQRFIDLTKEGKYQAAELIEAVSARANLDPLNKDLTKAAGKIADLFKGAADAQRALGRLATVQKEVNSLAYRNARDRLQEMGPEATSPAVMARGMYDTQIAAIQKMTGSSSNAIQGMLDAAARDFQRAMDEINRASKTSLADVTGQALEQRMDPRAAAISAIKREYGARIEESNRLSGSTEARLNLEREMTLKVQMATEELRRTEEARLANHQLDLRAIGARGAATLAEIEASRTAITLREQGYGADEIARRSREAADLSLAQSAFQQSESLRQRLEAQNEATPALPSEFEIMGVAEGGAAITGGDDERS